MLEALSIKHTSSSFNVAIEFLNKSGQLDAFILYLWIFSIAPLYPIEFFLNRIFFKYVWGCIWFRALYDMLLHNGMRFFEGTTATSVSPYSWMVSSVGMFKSTEETSGLRSLTENFSGTLEDVMVFSSGSWFNSVSELLLQDNKLG